MLKPVVRFALLIAVCLTLTSFSVAFGEECSYSECTAGCQTGLTSCQASASYYRTLCVNFAQQNYDQCMSTCPSGHWCEQICYSQYQQEMMMCDNHYWSDMAVCNSNYQTCVEDCADCTLP